MKTFININILSLLILSSSTLSSAQSIAPTVRACPSSPVVLKANAASTTDASGGYIWYKNGVQYAVTTNIAKDSVIISDPGTYTLATVSGLGCNSMVSAPIEVQAKELKAINDSVQAITGTPMNIVVTQNDLNGCDPINTNSTFISSSPKKGVANVNPNGTVTYTGNSTGLDSFTYTVKDVNGNVSNIAKVFVTIASNSPLAMDLLSFDVTKQTETTSLISWKVVGENKPVSFEIERSTDAKNFITIGKKESKPTANETSKFEWIDEQPSLVSRNFYRLKINDFDGVVSYSSVKSLQFSGTQNVVAYPNPASDKITVKSNAANIESIQLFDVYGKQHQVKTSGNDEINIDLANIAPGIYFIKVRSIDGSLEVLKFNKI